ncbi:MAG: immunity 53 family protein [Mycobacteriales bacterium]
MPNCRLPLARKVMVLAFGLVVERRYLPMWDSYDDHAPGVFTWLQAWYATQCDGDWEHGYGVSISTLDNPGWWVRIELTGTLLADKMLEHESSHRSGHDWYEVSRKGDFFEAHCGPLNLGEVLHLFRLWVEGPPAVAAT